MVLVIQISFSLDFPVLFEVEFCSDRVYDMITVFGLLFHLVLAIFGNGNKGEVIFFDEEIDNSLSRR